MNSFNWNPRPKPYDLRQRLFEFACLIVQIVQFLHTRGPVASALCDQLLRCGTSAGANYEEADDGSSNRDSIACPPRVRLPNRSTGSGDHRKRRTGQDRSHNHPQSRSPDALTRAGLGVGSWPIGSWEFKSRLADWRAPASGCGARRRASRARRWRGAYAKGRCPRRCPATSAGGSGGRSGRTASCDR